GAVTADKLAANSVTAGKIAAGAVKADAIDVDELSAISADLGTVTAGIVQTPDGRTKFGEGALGSGKHGMLVSDGTQDRVAVGDLSGRIWQGQTLPPGTYGLWAPDGYIAVSNSEFKQITDTVGTSTTHGGGFVDIPGFSVEFELSEPCMVMMMMSIEAAVTRLPEPGGPPFLESMWRLVLNDTVVPGSRRGLTIT